MSTIIHDDINAATGYANGDTFSNESQVREYFAPASQREMFGDDAVADADVLESWAERVIETRSHCNF